MRTIARLSLAFLLLVASSLHIQPGVPGELPILSANTLFGLEKDGPNAVVHIESDGATLRATPAELEFGDLPAGEAAPEQLVEIENFGTLTLEVADVQFRGRAQSAYELTFDDCTGSTLQPASTCILGVVFTPDRAGVFQVEMRINTAPLNVAGVVPIVGTSDVVSFSGFESSLLIGRQVPVADAGEDRDVPRGSPAQLDGSDSFDPENQPLSFLWSLEVPAGSNAELDNPNSAVPTFSPDVLGDYVATLIVSADGFVSQPDTATLSALPVITVDDVAFPTFSSAVLDFSLDQPAGSGGLELQLTNPSPALFATPDTFLVPEGQTAAELAIESGSMAGSSNFNAESPGYWPGNALVTVQLRQMSLELDPLVGIDRTNAGLLVLDLPAPAGGVDVALVSSDTSVVTVDPAIVSFVEGQTEASIEVTGISGGSATIAASAAGYADAEKIVGGTNSTVSIGEIQPMVPGQSTSLPISLSEPAPPGGTTIFFESADTSVATVDESVFIAEGQSQAPANPQVTGVSAGTTEIFARAEGFAPDARIATVSDIQVSLDPDPLQVFVGWTRPIAVTLSAAAPAGGLTVNLSGGDPAIFTAPDSFVVPAGQTTASFDITGVAVGTSSLTLSGTNLQQETFDVDVDPTPDMFFSDVAVGKDLQVRHSVRLSQTPPGPTDITVTVADGSTALLSTDPAAVGSTSITFTGVTDTGTQSFYVQGLVEATTTMTAQASGFNDAVRNVDVTPSGFHLGTSDFSTTTFSNNRSLSVELWRLRSDGALFSRQQLRPGAAPVDVAVTSSDTDVGTITTSPLTFQPAGDSRLLTAFDPATAGTATVSIVHPAGFTVPSNGRTSLTATVTAPEIFLSDVAVGKDLQVRHSVRLSQTPPGPTDITVTVADGSTALLSTDPAAVGSTSITFTGVTDTGTQSFYVQGLVEATTTMTAQASGFNDAVRNVDVTPSGFHLGTSDFSTTTFSNNRSLSVELWRLRSDGALFSRQQLRPGAAPVDVAVTSSDTDVGTITTSPLTFQPAGDSRLLTAFDPATAGTATVSIVHPAGFTVPSNGRTSLTATVTD